MSNSLSLIFYYSVFALTSVMIWLISCVDNREGKGYLIKYKGGLLHLRGKQLVAWAIMLLLPALVAALRVGIGTDYPAYEALYNKVSKIGIGDLSLVVQPTEFFSNLLYKVAFWLFDDFHGWLFLTSAVTLLVAYKAMHFHRESSNLFIMSFAFMSLLFAPSFNIVRQILAGSVVFLGIRYVIEKDYIRYFTIVIIATMIHTTAIFASIFYFLNMQNGKHSNIKQLLLAALCISVPILFPKAFELFTSFSAFRYYASFYGGQNGFLHVSDILLRIPIATVILLFRKSLEDHDSDSRFYELLFLMEFVALALTWYNRWLYRLMYYCIPGEIVLISRVPKCCTSKARPLVAMCIVVYYVLFFLVNNYFRGVDEIFPYISVFN